MNPDDKVANAAHNLLESLKMASKADVDYAMISVKDKGNNLTISPEDSHTARQLTYFLRAQYRKY